MKTIIAATDFSENANNACLYGIELAYELNAKLILFHAFQSPDPIRDIIIPVLSEDEMSEIATESLKLLKDKLFNESGKTIDLETIVCAGNPVEEILKFYHREKAGIVIMGLQGLSTLSELIIGSSTYELFTRQCNVLAIPENYKYHRPRHLLVAKDSLHLLSTNQIDLLSELVDQFQCATMLVSIVNEKEEIKDPDPFDQLSTKGNLLFASHYYKIHKDPAVGIAEFTDDHKADFIVIFPKQHSTWQRILSRSNTSKLAERCKYPLLTIPF